MKFIFEKTHNKMVSIMVAFDAGARAEGDKYTPGLAHMLEHMIFKGTEKRHYLDIPKEVAFLGGDINAYTSHEMVCYYIRVPFENFEAGMEILADITLNSVIPEEEFLKEREIVMEECLSYKDQVTYKLGEKFSEEFYSGRLAVDVIGTEESIAKFTRQELYDFYKEFYHTENAILCVSGDLDIDEMRSTSEKLFGSETSFVKRNGPAEHEYAKSDSFYVYKPEIEQSYVLVSWPGLVVSDEDRSTLTVLNSIFGSGMDSRLFTEVREKNNLCYGIYMSTQSHLEAGEITICSSTRAENIDKMLELVNIEIEKIKTELVDEEEIQRAKNKSKSDVYAIYDSGHSLARFKLMQEFYNTPSLEEVSSRIDRVTREDVLELANKIFNDEYKMTFVLTRGEE